MFRESAVKMLKMEIIGCFIVILLCLPPVSLSYDREMTIHVDAGKQDCFFQHAKTGDIIDVEYQVIDGGHGDLDISFELAEPVGRIIFADYKKPENAHRHETRVDGDYRICFDNRFSTFNKKTVFFELIVESESEASERNNAWNDVFEGLTPEEFYDVKVQDILDYMGRIKINLNKARHVQDLIRSHEARDRNIAEENFFKVNAWSMFQICTMVSVGALQVFMVRSIFETDSKIQRIWKKLNL